MYEYNATVIRVVDGDTLVLLVELGFGTFRKLRVRLEGIDTPEVHRVKRSSEEYQKGLVASTFTKDWVKKVNGEVKIQSLKKTKGKFGRWIVALYPRDGGDSLNKALVDSGNAKTRIY